jgi:archaetidylinositol phosphate synthase
MAKQGNFKSAERIQQGFLAGPEKWALNRLVRRLPGWVTPDHLTLLGFAALFLAGVAYAMSAYRPAMLHLVNLCLIINWFGDSLDGTLARYRNRQRPRYGYYVDHIADALGTLFLLAGLALSGYMSERIACGLLVTYLLLSINSYLWAHAMGEFRLSFYRFSPTELRVLLIVGNLFLLYRPTVHFWDCTAGLYDIGGTVGTGLMVLMLVVSAIRNTRRLYCLERI